MKKSKVLEAVWATTLLTIIVVGCFYLLLLGAQCYKNIVAKTNQSENERLPVAYIATSLRMVNKDQVQLEYIEGIECLSLEFEGYKKMIYAEGGYLKEVAIKQGAIFSISDGEQISKVESINFDISDSNVTYQIVVGEKIMDMIISLR